MELNGPWTTTGHCFWVASHAARRKVLLLRESEKRSKIGCVLFGRGLSYAGDHFAGRIGSGTIQLNEI